MEHFIHEEARPSEMSLNIIRQFAYSYNKLKMNNEEGRFCIN